MNKRLEAALAAERKAAARRADLERHERLKALASDFRSFVSKKNYGDAHAAAFEACGLIEEMPQQQADNGELLAAQTLADDGKGRK